jgi:multiple sugar transport system substrate-binding protein
MRKTMRRGGRSALGALAIAMVATACGSGTPGTPAAESDDDEAPSGDGKTVVRFWQNQFQDEENEWYESVVEAFNAAHDDIEVRHETVPGDAWDERLTAAQAAGNAPDVRTMNYGDIVDAARTSQITPLTSLISDEAWGDVKENVLELVTLDDGDHYAYPLLVEPSAVLYYRTDLFEAAGLDPDAPPTSWDELIDYAEQLTDDEVFGIRLARNAPDASWSTWGYQYNLGGLPISDDWSTAAADDRFAPLLQAFQDLFASGALPPDEPPGYPDATPFGEGKFAMMANGSWAASLLINDYPELVDNVAVAAMPSFNGQPGQPTATLGGWTLVVDGKSDVAEAAATFIEWVLGSDPETVASFFEATKFSKSSARESVDEALADMPGADSVNPWSATIAEEIVPYAAGEPSYPWDVSLAMGEAIEQAMQGTPVDQALAEANDKIQTAIDNLGLGS